MLLSRKVNGVRRGSTRLADASDPGASRQDLSLLWPAEVAAPTAPGRADPELPRHLEARGFTPVAEGRLDLRKRAERDPVPGVGTLIKIPWPT